MLYPFLCLNVRHIKIQYIYLEKGSTMWKPKISESWKQTAHVQLSDLPLLTVKFMSTISLFLHLKK